MVLRPDRLRRPVRPLRLPLVALAGFAAAFGGAVWTSVHAGSTPVATLHAAVSTYLQALQDDDPAAAEALRLSADPGDEADRARAWRGLSWFVQALAIDEEGRTGLAKVVWLDEGGRVVDAEEQAWYREPGGPWRLGRVASAARPRWR